MRHDRNVKYLGLEQDPDKGLKYADCIDYHAILGDAECPRCEAF
jgi:hypothetical protein